MGCWNHTCMLTNLPVSCGEEIATIILMETREGYASLDAGRNWHPAPVMYYGSYDDYGGSEDCHGSQIDYILDEFRIHTPFDEDITIDGIEDFSRKGDSGELRLCGNGTNGASIDINLAVIKQSVLDKLLERYYWTDYYLKTADDEEVKITYKYLCGTIPLYIAKLKEHYAGEFVWEPVPDVEWNSTDILGKFVQHHAKDVTPQFFRKSFVDKLKELAVADDDEALTDLLEEFCKYCMIQSYYSYSRRVFIRPMCSSQETDPKAQKLTADITLEVVEQERIEWEKEDFPDDAWDPQRELFMEQAKFEF